MYFHLFNLLRLRLGKVIMQVALAKYAVMENCWTRRRLSVHVTLSNLEGHFSYVNCLWTSYSQWILDAV